MDNQIFIDAKKASRILKNASKEDKNFAIECVSNKLLANSALILEQNAKDVEIQKALGTSPALIDRLTLNIDRLTNICNDMLKVASLNDPIGETISEWTADSGIIIKKVRVPFGVIGIIYEARPNVTVDVFTLCLKTGNACLLKGSKDAARTNECVVKIIRSALSETKILADSIILMDSDRSSAEALIKARDYVDLIIPRGSKGLIEYVVSNSLVPVIETGAGVCHTYVCKDADLEQAFSILKNAKMSRPSVCNACETLLVDSEIAEKFINMVSSRIPNLVLHGENNEKLLCKNMQSLTDKGYNTEYGNYELSVKIVNGVEQAVEHINQFGTHHSDCICTTSKQNEDYFLNNVDSACVYANASTRFSDGGCFGFGAELGISTQKSHARGPMGLVEMTSYQYKIYGKGQVR